MTEQAEEAAEVVVAAEPTVEDRAKEMGWRPKEEFNDDARWVDADTFVKRGEEILPIVRANAKKVEAENAALKADMATLKKDVAAFRVHHSQTEQRAYQRALRDLEERQADAVHANDLGAVREITKEIADLTREVRADGDNSGASDIAKLREDWDKENPWINDPDMGAYAYGVCEDMARRGVKPKDQLVELAKRVKQAFPQKFQNERRSAPAAVEGGTPPRRAGKTRSDLPLEARQTMDRWVKQGLLTEAQFLKDYWT